MPTNPFRNPAISPSHTGQPTTYQPPPGPPPSHAASTNSGGPAASLTDEDLGGDLNEELPPAYTVQPDATQGEETLDIGPRRPFQPVEARLPPIPNSRPNPQSQNNNSSNHSWSAYPGQQQQNQYQPPRPLLSPQWSGSSIPPPPPRHPYSASRQNSASISAPNLQETAVSDFAREFYAGEY